MYRREPWKISSRGVPMPNANLKYGPQTAAILVLIKRVGRLTGDEITALGEAGAAAWAARVTWSAAWDVVDEARDLMSAAGDAAWAAVDAARDAWTAAQAPDVNAWDTWTAARDVIWAAAMALVFRDQLPPDVYGVLTGPWGEVCGRVHPDD
jgi:hypothetical protein